MATSKSTYFRNTGKESLSTIINEYIDKEYMPAVKNSMSPTTYFNFKHGYVFEIKNKIDKLMIDITNIPGIVFNPN